MLASGRSVRDRDLERLTASTDEDSDAFGVEAASGAEVSDAVATTRLFRVAGLGSFAAVACLCLLGTGLTGSTRRGAKLPAAVGLSEVGAASAARAEEVAAAELMAPNTLAQAPLENMHDGNVCATDEEEHMGLCYEKCSALAGPTFPHRTSAWTCCQQANCVALFSCCAHNVGFCSGFDIAGMSEGHKICPHKPGVCLQDEELFLELCYMKCEVLTGGEYPHRSGPATCCKKSDASCLFQDGTRDGLNGNAITNASFDVGGGCNDDLKKTHCKPHQPQASLTEA